jgi:hypothetical protein
MGWRVVHFSFDDIQNHPDVCRSLLQLIVNPYLIKSQSIRPAAVIEKEVLRFAWSLVGQFAPSMFPLILVLISVLHGIGFDPWWKRVG